MKSPFYPKQQIKTGAKAPQKPNGGAKVKPGETVGSEKILEGNIIEYEQHGKPVLAYIMRPRGDKYELLNEYGESLQLAGDRLFLLEIISATQDLKELKKISEQIKSRANELEAETLWKEAVKTYLPAKTQPTEAPQAEIKKKEFSLEELFFWSGLNPSPIENASFRRMLILDSVYFKRSKQGFSPRTEEEVGRSKEIKSENLRLESDKLALRLAIQKRLSGNLKAPLPPAIQIIEELAACGRKSSYAKPYQELIDDFCKAAGIEIRKKMSLEEKALELLVKIGHFNKDQNLIPLRLGRPVAFSGEERTEAERLFQEFKKEFISDRQDLSHLETFTIDSDSSSDFDDAVSLEYEGENLIVGVHISDASFRISKGSILEKTAFRRATSIYCPDETIPMLPQTLSEGVLSLKEGAKRPCVSFIIHCNPSLEIISRKIVPSIIEVKERMTYEQVDEILCDGSAHVRSSVLEKLWELASQHETHRIEQGSIQFNRRDLVPEIRPNGKIHLAINNDDTPARKLISELAIIANETAALFAADNRIPFVYRSQEKPDIDIEKSSMTVPDGPAREFFKRGLLKRSLIGLKAGPHAGLGLAAYCQVTSPIRRALDLVLLRQLSSFITDSKPCYSSEDLDEIIQILTPGLDEAMIIQRERNRFWLYKYMQQERLTTFTGTIVRADPPRPLIELDNLYSIHSFVLNKPLGNTPQPQLLGKKIQVEVKKIDPSQDILYLHEVSAPE